MVVITLLPRDGIVPQPEPATELVFGDNFLPAQAGSSSRNIVSPSKTYPSTGKLGKTDVTVHGVLKISLEEDHKPLKQATAIIVRIRCYESDGQGVGSLRTAQTRVLHETATTLWRPPMNSAEGHVGVFEKAFKLTMPVGALHETRDGRPCSTVVFKSWRVWWAIEGVITHRPHAIYGSALIKSHPLGLVNYAPPVTRNTLTWSSRSIRSRPKEPIDYSFVTAAPYLGQGDPIAFRCSLQRSMSDHRSDFKRVTIEITRELLVSRSLERQPRKRSIPSETARLETETRSQSLPIIHLVSPDSKISRDVSTVLTIHMAAEEMEFDTNGAWTGQIVAKMPTSRPGHYSIGETTATALASVRFFVNISLHFRSRQTATIKLPPREIFVVSPAASVAPPLLAGPSAETVPVLRQSPVKRRRPCATARDSCCSDTVSCPSTVDFSGFSLQAHQTTNATHLLAPDDHAASPPLSNSSTSSDLTSSPATPDSALSCASVSPKDMRRTSETPSLTPSFTSALSRKLKFFRSS
ncbi:uncharacterized protein L969DRAFT_86640 [Mixia osmundae IAM 14324]|uniref:Uncharacterized protein n=1 Tax=Mixia osmundae (strain CBS 9802 / IAM 14324 / JCM 22182 / KY 12970) TaxID=764103 RepID=G7E9T0_MIXOS|nr:uncharacterized protein L969DRAFT_86640 [Mixia osmundae IAM 14324]KEI40032.1 hypothetical protein L969DRAFT_86640 [Mixia osmundae IAM 14324]GAA99399.1 hypothetical protein E5Q_06097 [Mixia osmundae IAM 14324]